MQTQGIALWLPLPPCPCWWKRWSRVALLQNNTLEGAVPSAVAARFPAPSFALNCLSSCGQSRQPSCASVDGGVRRSLVALYWSTGGGAWLSSSNWLVGDPCTNAWLGVACFPPAAGFCNGTVQYVGS